MLKLTSPFLSDGFTSPSTLCWQYPLRRFNDPCSKQKSLTASTHMKTQMPFLHVLAGKPVKPIMSISGAYTSDHKDKLVVVMGATGSGKSRLSVHLATVFSGEIINSDKLQFYDGLKITTNQIPVSQRCGIPHHLLGELHPDDGQLRAAEFRSAAALAISEIVSRGKLPILAGGSNSFVHALVSERWDPETDPFNGWGSICSELKYDCCFIWIDVSLPVLLEYLSKRVDEMLERGMFEELAKFYNPKNDPGDGGTRMGIWKAIGVPEFDGYFREYPPEENKNASNKDEWDAARKAAYEKAVREVKENTFVLAKKQIEKMMKLRSAGWDIKRVDATEAFEAALSTPAEEDSGDGGGGRGIRWKEIWDKVVLEPSVDIVRNYVFHLG